MSELRPTAPIEGVEKTLPQDGMSHLERSPWTSAGSAGNPWA